MKIDFMITLIAISFITVTGLMVSEMYTQNQAVAAGLQQCVVGNTVLWQKECN